jgi:NAD(P) transhydrogenase subunit alpha
LLEELSPKKDGNININFDDEVIRGTTVVKDGQITWPPPAPKIVLAAVTVETENEKGPLVLVAKAGGHSKKLKKSSLFQLAFRIFIAGAILAFVGSAAPVEFMSHFTVFVLACFVGYMVVWDVTPALHTPLMSVTNAISSIIVLGALLKVSSGNPVVVILSMLAVVLTSINMVGGFAVTQRMLVMFRK